MSAVGIGGGVAGVDGLEEVLLLLLLVVLLLLCVGKEDASSEDWGRSRAAEEEARGWERGVLRVEV